ncbi:hypothetical protein OROGR_016525 [Orobanche gracilis]
MSRLLPLAKQKYLKSKVAKTVTIGSLLNNDMAGEVHCLAREVGTVCSVTYPLPESRWRTSTPCWPAQDGCKMNASSILYTIVESARQCVAALQQKEIQGSSILGTRTWWRGGRLLCAQELKFTTPDSDCAEHFAWTDRYCGLQICAMCLWRLGKNDIALAATTSLASSILSMEENLAAASISFICRLLYNISGQESAITSILKMPRQLFRSSKISFIVSAIHVLDPNNQLESVVSSIRSFVTSRDEIISMHMLITPDKLLKNGNENFLGIQKGVDHLRKADRMFPSSSVLTIEICAMCLWRLGKNDIALAATTSLASSILSMEENLAAASISFICRLLYNISGQESAITSILKMPRQLFRSSKISFIVSAIHVLDPNNQLESVLKNGNENFLGIQKGVDHLRKADRMFPSSSVLTIEEPNEFGFWSVSVSRFLMPVSPFLGLPQVVRDLDRDGLDLLMVKNDVFEPQKQNQCK